jgi:hypothetical protein
MGLKYEDEKTVTPTVVTVVTPTVVTVVTPTVVTPTVVTPTVVTPTVVASKSVWGKIPQSIIPLPLPLPLPISFPPFLPLLPMSIHPPLQPPLPLPVFFHSHPPLLRKNKWDIVDPVIMKMVKAVVEINKKVEKIASVELETKVKKAKEKAFEITQRLFIDEEKTWTKVNKTKCLKEDKVLVLRVPKKDAEIALLSAIRNGLTNFKIEYSDS